jgi:hypothetical protein
MGRRKLIRALLVGLVVLPVLVGLVVLPVVLAVAPWPRTQPDHFPREKFDRIQRGMTRAEVTAILGPPVNCTTVPMSVPAGGATGVAWSGTEAERSELPYGAWLDDSTCIWVGFDQSDKVVYADYYENSGRQRGILPILLERLERQFWKWFFLE